MTNREQAEAELRWMTSLVQPATLKRLILDMAKAINEAAARGEAKGRVAGLEEAAKEINKQWVDLLNEGPAWLQNNRAAGVMFACEVVEQMIPLGSKLE